MTAAWSDDPGRSEPAGLYLHVPFCSAVCPYCDFAVQIGRREVRARYVESLLAEIALAGDWRAPIDTVYLGGGTPSLLEAEQLAEILDAARAKLPVHEAARISLEANPEDVTPERVAAWRGLGIDTVSLGVQSFVAAELEALGRRHDPGEARAAVRACLDGGFSTVSVDLMFGLPGQTVAHWESSLAEVAALSPGHVSCYQLTIHEGTTFGRRAASGKLSEMPEAAQARLFSLTHRRLADAGYAAYEVSNFARAPGHRSRHNRKYWRHVPYLGLGPAAHSFDGGSRWWNRRRLQDWADSIERGERPIEGRESLSRAALALESLMLGLRTCEGIDLEAFRRLHGMDLARDNAALLERLLAEGLMHEGDGRLAPTVRGLAVADGLAARFRLGPE